MWLKIDLGLIHDAHRLSQRSRRVRGQLGPERATFYADHAMPNQFVLGIESGIGVDHNLFFVEVRGRQTGVGRELKGHARR